MIKILKQIKLLSFLLFSCFVFHLQAQNSNPFLNHSQSLLLEGDRYVMLHNYDSARHCFNLAQRECYAELRKLSQDTNSLILLYRIQTQLGKLHTLESEYRLAERAFQEALLSAKKFGGRKEMGFALHNLGATYSQIGDIDRAYQNYQKAIFFEKNTGDSLALANTLNNIGETFYLQYEFPTAITFLFEALEIRNALGDVQENSSTLNSITLAYLKQNKLDSATIFLQQAKSIAIQFNDSLNLARMYRNQGELLIRRKQFSSSIPPLTKCLNINVKLQNKVEIALCYKLMSEAYMEVGMLDEAERYAFKSLDLGIRFNLVEVRVEVLRVLSESYLLKKDYRNAYLLKKEYKAAKDSFINKANNARLYELKMIYQANSKDQALVQKKRELELQHISSKRFGVELLFYSILLLGLVALLLFIYFGYRSKVRNEQRLRNKQRLNQEQKTMILDQMALLETHTKNIRIHNEEIRQQNEKLETKRELIKKQTLILETQQSEIIDSLFYAQKIQKAVFSTFAGQQNDEIDDFFAYVPGDIISSSFVWKEELANNYVYIIVDSLTPGILSSLSTLMIFTQMKSWISKVKRMKAEDINKFFLHKINELIEDEFGVELNISTLLFHPKHAHIEFYGQHSLWIVDEEEETKREFSEQKQTIIKQTETVYIFSNSYSNLLEIDSVGLLFEKMYNKPSQQKKEILEASVPETRNRASSDFFMLGLKVANYQ